MPRAVLVFAAVVMAAACTQGTAESSPTAASARATAASPQVARSCSPSASYGLLISEGRDGSPGKLELVDPKGCVQATAQVAPASSHVCSSGIAALLAPPVSASETRVYFRDGDTKIRSITPSGQTADVTTVPGGPNVVSSFSVSPDDQRIAVVVQDFSALPAIGLQIYVENLMGGGHHVVTFTTTLDGQSKVAPNLWPLGWHGSSLVVLVVPACSVQQVSNPIAWHVVDADTATRQVSVGSSTCLPGWWPVPDMLTCYDTTKKQINLYDSSGILGGTIATDPGSPAVQPGGLYVAVSNAGPSPTTVIQLSSNGGGSYKPVTVDGAAACLWIDNTSLLAPGAVIQLPGAVVPETPGSRCAGRFPGRL